MTVHSIINCSCLWSAGICNAHTIVSGCGGKAHTHTHVRRLVPAQCRQRQDPAVHPTRQRNASPSTRLAMEPAAAAFLHAPKQRPGSSSTSSTNVGGSSDLMSLGLGAVLGHNTLCDAFLAHYWEAAPLPLVSRTVAASNSCCQERVQSPQSMQQAEQQQDQGQHQRQQHHGFRPWLCQLAPAAVFDNLLAAGRHCPVLDAWEQDPVRVGG